MKIAGVNLPETILDAREHDQLVIFAGAGVSFPHPSSLPNFRDLALQIAHGTGNTIRNEESEDVFLGRLRDAGVKVQDRASEILLNPESKPNSLHTDLLSLFRSPDKIKLVTTNFDLHFEVACQKVYAELPEIFSAPALPVGSNFDGLVYVHGSAKRSRQHLVLTDDDFGRAYLTEGWARRFLQELFSKYVVLFVGYSHNDTVLRYLARGLPPVNERRRFAFDKGDMQIDRWRNIGVDPIIYPPDDNDGHSTLASVVKRWAELSNYGALDTEGYIERIVATQPTLDDDTNSYLDRALQDPVSVVFFTRYAKDPAWLQWVEERGYLNSLFNTEPLDEKARQLGSWVANSFLLAHSQKVLALTIKHGQKLNPDFWWNLNRVLSHAEKVSSSDLEKWATILVASAQDHNEYFLIMLLKKCIDQRADYATVEIFGALTSPKFVTKEPFSLNADSETHVTIELMRSQRHTILTGCWEQMKTNLDSLVHLLWPTVVQNLTRAHNLRRAWNSTSSAFDPESYRRAAIEPHEQDKYREPVDVLIDAARDILEFLIKHEPEIATAMTELLARSKSLLSRRLAIHGVRLSNLLSSDQKIEWLVERDLLRAAGMKQESFSLLRDTFSTASPQARMLVLERVDHLDDGDQEQDSKRKYSYKKYNILHWLHGAAPNCTETKSRLDAIERENPEFEKREHPDLDHWTGAGWVGTSSPTSAAQLLENRPGEQIQFLLDFQGERALGPDRSGLLSSVCDAVKQDSAWGLDLCKALMDRKIWETDVWSSLLRGLEDSITTDAELRSVILVLSEPKLVEQQQRALGSFLGNFAEKMSLELLKETLLLGGKLANSVWRSSEKIESNVQSNDWLTSALNHPAGQSTMYWLHTISRTEKLDEPNATDVVRTALNQLELVANENSTRSRLGKALLGAHLGFLFTVDEDWCVKHVIAIFDWSRSELDAQAAWDGFLYWGRWTEPLLVHLIPMYQSSFSRLATELVQHREQFADHIADITIFGIDDPLSDWLPCFFAQADDLDHVNLANAIARIISAMKVDVKEKLWNRWLHTYWENRTQGIPIPLSRTEVGVMAEWVLALEPVFEEAVKLFCKSPEPKFGDSSVLYDMKENSCIDSQPDAFTRFVLHILSDPSQIKSYEIPECEEIARKLVEAKAPTQLLIELLDQLATTGSSLAKELRQQLS